MSRRRTWAAPVEQDSLLDLPAFLRDPPALLEPPRARCAAEAPGNWRCCLQAGHSGACAFWGWRNKPLRAELRALDGTLWWLSS